MTEKWIEEAAASCDNLLSHRGLKREFAAIIQRHYEKAAQCPECNGAKCEMAFGTYVTAYPCKQCGGKGRIVP